MTRTSWPLALLGLLVVLGWAGASQAQCCSYKITGGGGQGQIGDGLPIPIQLATTGNAGTQMTPTGTGMVPNATGPYFWGDRGVGSLRIPAKIGATVMQQPDGKNPWKMTVKAGRFTHVPKSYLALGVVPNNELVFQVRTNLSLSGPGNFPINATNTNNTVNFAAYNRTSVSPNMVMGGANTTTFKGSPAGSSFITYRNTTKRFGGASQTRVDPKSDVWVWINGGMVDPPCKAFFFGGNPADTDDQGCFGPLVLANPASMAVAGGPAGVSDQTTPMFAMSPGVAQLSILVANGTINQSLSVIKTANVRNTATSVGFPWTVGKITILQTQTVGLGTEKFTITGMDARNSLGIGTISLVSGSLSDRNISGPNANRGWARYSLPEPAAVLGAGAALAVLGICHALVRRRSR